MDDSDKENYPPEARRNKPSFSEMCKEEEDEEDYEVTFAGAATNSHTQNLLKPEEQHDHEKAAAEERYDDRYRVRYNRVILHDIAPRDHAPRMFATSVKNSGFDQVQIDNLVMTVQKRNKPRLLDIYQPSRLFNLIAKVEVECTIQELQQALNTLRSKMETFLRAKLPVEEAVNILVHRFPGHVCHGLYYQERGLPAKCTLRRYDRSKLIISDSNDDTVHTGTRSNGNKNSVSSKGTL